MNQKAALAELLGTFTLTFIGAGVGAMADENHVGVLGVAWAHGLALMVIVYIWGSISGAHVNPAVTFGVAVAGKMPWSKAVLYWIAQCVGAVAAAYLLAYMIGTTSGLGQTTGSLTKPDPTRTVVIEAVLTAFLVLAVMASGIYGKNGNIAGVAIGLVLTMDILFGATLTGASMNPARTLGPAVVVRDFSYLNLYIIGPMLGGGVAGLMYEKMFAGGKA